MKKILTFFVVVMLVTTLVRAGAAYTDFTNTNAAGAIATDKFHKGSQSYKVVGAGAGNPEMKITINGITNWTTITKATMWIYTSSGWNNGQTAVNSSSPGWKSKSFDASSNAWKLIEWDFSATPFAAAASWGQFLVQFYNSTGDLYFDEISFFNASGALVYEIDASDVSVAPTKITVAPKTAALVPAKTLQLGITPTPSNAGVGATYVSKNTSVATVTATGKVTTVAAGIDTIIVTSSLDAAIKDTAIITVTAASVANSMVFASFEDGMLGNYDGSWVGKKNIVTANPSKTGINLSEKALQLDSCMTWDGLAFKAVDWNKYNTVKFKIYTDSTDFGFQVGINNVSGTSISYTATAKAWTEFTYTVSSAPSASQQLFFQRTGAGKTTAPGYTFYIDDLVYYAGDVAKFAPVKGISVVNDTIKTDNGTLQIAATITPDTATNKSLTFSLVNGKQSPDTATISATGLLTAVRDGIVKVKVVSNDGGFTAIKDVVIMNQVVPVARIGVKVIDTIYAAKGPAKFTVGIYPNDADTLSYKVSLVDSAGVASTKASFDTDSTIEALENGYAILKVVADGNNTIIAQKTIAIVYQVVAVDTVEITAMDTAISWRQASLQLKANIYPYFATNTSVSWSVISNANLASVSSTGLVTALGTGNGDVWVKVTTNDGAKTDSIKVTISNNIPFNIITFEGDAPWGTKIVEIDGVKFLQVVVNGWNSASYIKPIVTSSFYKASCKFKYSLCTATDDTLVLSNINGVVQLMDTVNLVKNPWGDNMIPSFTGISESPVTGKIVTLSKPIDVAMKVINQIQFYGQQNISWGPTVGDTIWMSQLVLEKNTNTFDIAKIVVGKVDNATDYQGSVTMNWDNDSVYMVYNVADDSIVNEGASYQVDNIEVYFDMKNSKNIHYPRNGGWLKSVDDTYDEGDYQLRLVPDVDFDVNNSAKPGGPSLDLAAVNQMYTATQTGYQFKLNVSLKAMLATFEAAAGKQIGFDVLLSDNDAVASDANRNQIVFNSPTANPYNDPSLFATVELVADGTFKLIADKDAPTTPANVKGTAVSSNVTVTWDAATDNRVVQEYIVSQGTTVLATILALKEKNTFTVKGLADGKYTFSVKAVDVYGNVSKEGKSAEVTVTGVNINNATTSMAFYPNPVSSILNIQSQDAINTVSVINLAGQVERVVSVNANNASISFEGLSMGTYIVKVQTGNGVNIQRIVKR